MKLLPRYGGYSANDFTDIHKAGLLPRYGGYSSIVGSQINAEQLLPRYGGYSLTSKGVYEALEVASPLWGLFQTELDLDDNSDDLKQVELFDEKGGA